MISKNESSDITKSHLGSLKSYELRPIHGKDFYHRVYGNFDWDNSWVVIVSEKDKWPSIESSYIVLVHMLSGKVTYSGYANDEG